MRQAIIVYGLILAVLLAALGLSYVGMSQSRRVSATFREGLIQTRNELADDKVINIQTLITRSDSDVFEQVDLDRLSDLPKILEKSPFTASIVVLGLDKKLVAGGSYTKDEDIEGFKKLVLARVVPALDLDHVGLNERRHLHQVFDGRPRLFAYTKRFVDGRMYYVLVETDVTYLITAVFPQFFDFRSKYIFQVVYETGELVYGYPFSAPERVDVPFADTLSLWRLRVMSKDSPAIGSVESRQRTLDLLRIILPAFVCVAGLIVVLLAVRRERRVSQLKSEFISNVSHELKTPLSIISMFGELLSMGRVKSPEQGKEYAEIIRRESVRLSRLIDTVLDFSKIERGVDVYEFADDQDLREVVVRALDISRHRLERAGMTLETELAEDLPPLRMDGNAMTLLVLNLVDNALKYAEGGKHLRVRLAREGEGVVLEVCDRGPGVPPDEWEAVFSRFYRSRTVRLKPIRGSGIGLALVKHVAEAHGGEVAVDGAPGGGARFRAWIPAGGRA